MTDFDHAHYARLAASVVGEATPAVAMSVRHNLAILRAIHWGARKVTASPIDFDPRDEWWFRPERRFEVAFLSDTWQTWPSDASKHPFIEQFCVALSSALDGLRERNEITFYDVEYERGGGRAKVLAPIQALVAKFEDHGWSRCRPQRLAKLSAAEALTAFVDAIERDDFGDHERSLKELMRWWAVLGADSPRAIVDRQRFFCAYHLLICTTNAYVTAGAQYFGPVIGNTKVSVFRKTIQRWHEGALLSEAPLKTLDRQTNDPIDRSNTSIARELWGFLNLHGGPFYNAQAVTYLEVDKDPIRATLAIGEKTRAWLAANPVQETALAGAFERWLPRAQRAGKLPLFIVRRNVRKLDAKGEARDVGSPLDEQIANELSQQGSAYLLERFGPRDRAAIMLHLALDAEIRPRQIIPDDEDDDGETEGTTYAVPASTGGLVVNDADTHPDGRLAAAAHVWIYSPGEAASGFPVDLQQKVARLYWSGIGDLHDFESRAELVTRTSKGGDSSMLWAFSRKVVVGDILVARKGRRTIIGLGRVTRPYFHVADQDDDGAHRLGVDWFWTGVLPLAPETLPFTVWAFVNGTRRKQELLDRLRESPGRAALGDPMIDVVLPAPAPPYLMAAALEDLFFTEAELRKWLGLLERRHNLVLTGPPGVGKTFIAQRLAWLLIEAKNDDAITFVQFHQAYSYEQFVLGYRPAGGAPGSPGARPQFELAKGPLFRAAEQAHADPDETFVLIIDEINRGNISRILGEALMLLETDKRSPRWGLELAYTLEHSKFEGKFYLPPNLYVIGTMNTADRSLAVVDYALRRRFAFVDVTPRVDSEEFADWMRDKGLPESVLDRLRECVKQLNQRIAQDPALGSGFAVGHSFFTVGENIPWRAGSIHDVERLAHAWLDEVFEYELEPLLREYWAEDHGQFEASRRELRKGRP